LLLPNPPPPASSSISTNYDLSEGYLDVICFINSNTPACSAYGKCTYKRDNLFPNELIIS
jgi:hypothetical protein